MAGFGQDRERSERAERTPRDRVDRAPSAPDPMVAQLIALQQSAGNAAVSGLIARSRVLQRQGDAGAPPAAPAAPAAPAPAAAPGGAGGGNDALLAMTRVAWQTGVTQREQEAAAILHRPRAGKPQLEQADAQLIDAKNATSSIGAQLAALDPNRETRAHVHSNAITAARFEIKPLLERVTPGEIGDTIDAAVVPSGERTIADLTAPLPAGGAPAGGAPPAAPAPALPPRSTP